ncbi:HAD domain-containing protein [Sphingobacterium ginsenosidimutans]|uniref:FCP1 homology domain-containing protein n=1 Tax=Sphingobacterium ginsenosidimutans TaxID=687845 RepID=A0ABP8A557_9SPHI
MIFFLDIDGVMVHANPHRQVEQATDGFYVFSSAAVETFNAVFIPKEDQVILSTSHRFKYSLEEWKKLFADRGIQIDSLALLEDVVQKVDHRYTRKDEILDQIACQNIRPEQMIIIDDDKSLNDLPQVLKSRLVLTTSYIGLAEMDLPNLKNILNR